MKKALYTQRVSTGNRTFYFNINESKNQTNYLLISEVNKKDEDNVEKRRIIIFENEIEEFAAAMSRVLINFKASNDANVSRDKRIEAAKKDFPNAYEKWSKKEDAELALLFSEGNAIENISSKFQRPPGAIKSRIEKLELTRTEVRA